MGLVSRDEDYTSNFTTVLYARRGGTNIDQSIEMQDSSTQLETAISSRKLNSFSAA